MRWNERSKTDWLAEGDRNTKFFHAQASSRWKKNVLIGLQNADHEWIEWPEDIQGIVSTYFQNLLLSRKPSDQDLDAILSVIQVRISPEMNQHPI